jgi:pimeloyl-ACP methyl ester carboxylesterase
MAHFVLVHGAWHGAWCWREVGDRLRRAGHAVHAPTLTGLGEFEHRSVPAIGLRDHVQDIVGLIEYEDLREVVLVGHGYAGMLLAGVAEEAQERLAALVYVDAWLPRDGECVLDLIPAAMRAHVRPRRDGWRVAPPEPEALGLTDRERARWVRERLVDQPLATFTERVRRRHDPLAPPGAFVLSCPPLMAAMAERAFGEGLCVYELPAGHDVMLSAPDALARLLRAPFIREAIRRNAEAPWRPAPPEWKLPLPLHGWAPAAPDLPGARSAAPARRSALGRSRVPRPTEMRT